MDLNSYLSNPGDGSRLARKLGVSPVLVSQWRNGVRPVPADRCPDIERATNGVVMCEDLRPDVDWAVLRNSREQVAALATTTAAATNPWASQTETDSVAQWHADRLALHAPDATSRTAM